eukprot:scaffold230984_cov31-Tisochrysis_lutea.AAC.6
MGKETLADPATIQLDVQRPLTALSIRTSPTQVANVRKFDERTRQGMDNANATTHVRDAFTIHLPCTVPLASQVKASAA